MCVISCATPLQHYNNGDYRDAIRQANSNIEKKKDIEENLDVLNACYHTLIAQTLQKHHNQIINGTIDDWKIAQEDYYDLLADIGKSNIRTQGKIQDLYDSFCDSKINIDFQITEHLYEEGERIMEKFYASMVKNDARNACIKFQECIDYGGEVFFNSLLDKKNLAQELGTVFIYCEGDAEIISEDFTKQVFDKENADCILERYESFITTNTVQISSNKETVTREIEVGKGSEKDTSGFVKYFPIMEKVSADVNTEIYRSTASACVNFKIIPITDQCNQRSSSDMISNSETFEIVTWSGDSRAFKSGPPSTNSVSEHEVERRLRYSLDLKHRFNPQ